MEEARNKRKRCVPQKSFFTSKYHQLKSDRVHAKIAERGNETYGDIHSEFFLNEATIAI